MIVDRVKIVNRKAKMKQRQLTYKKTKKKKQKQSTTNTFGTNNFAKKVGKSFICHQI